MENALVRLRWLEKNRPNDPQIPKLRIRLRMDEHAADGPEFHMPPGSRPDMNNMQPMPRGGQPSSPMMPEATIPVGAVPEKPAMSMQPDLDPRLVQQNALRNGMENTLKPGATSYNGIGQLTPEQKAAIIAKRSQAAAAGALKRG